MKRKNHRFIIITSILLTVGFSCVSLFSYFVANQSINKHIQSNTLPLTSDNIYSEIQRDILPTIVISSLMAQDTFVRDWVNQGEIYPHKMTLYLKSIQERYHTATAFFISDKSLNYYHSTGLLRKVDQSAAADQWYFKVKHLKSDFEINLDTDTANPQQTNIFVNHKMFDIKGDYLGVIGVGLSSNAVVSMINHYRTRYNREIYFSDTKGKIVLSSSDNHPVHNISQIQGLSDIASQVLSEPSGSFQYSNNLNTVYLQTRFVPELNWYLLVEQIEEPNAQIVDTLWINLVFSFLITAIVLLLANLTLGKYQQNLELMATQDKLTGINNRHGFDASLRDVLKETEHNQRPLSIAIVDIDLFKNINDQYGHSAGDKVLVKIAHILQNGIRDTDSLCRWGGEEFLILLPNCEIAKAKVIIEKLRAKIEKTKIKLDHQEFSITASFGVSDYRQGESQQSAFERVDAALYQAKAGGRNCVMVL